MREFSKKNFKCFLLFVCFFSFYHFTISKSLILKNLFVSSLNSDDDGVVEVESPCLSPLALAACMSIDSCFDPSLIPFVQVQASYDLLKVSMFNYFDRKGNYFNTLILLFFYL